MSWPEAATLPVAGLTALYALEKGGSLLGRSVLVTGASGGAGHFAIQLACLSGARVVALVRREEHERLVREAGAHEIAIGEDAESAGALGPYHLILESVGGKILGDVIGMLAPDGMCVSFGVSGGRRQRSTFGASIPRAGRGCTALYSSTRCWHIRRPMG